MEQSIGDIYSFWEGCYNFYFKTELALLHINWGISKIANMKDYKIANHGKFDFVEIAIFGKMIFQVLLVEKV